jgi:HD-like signal output (HDOD) protein
MPTINDLLDQPHNLPSIPEVVRDLIQTFNQKDPDLLHIANKIAKDPVISAKVLRLANSARFGCSRQVATIQEATVRLGLDTVRNMVLASGLADSFRKVPGINLKFFWGHVFEVAEISKQLAKALKQKGETTFTSALMHNLGRLVMHTGLPDPTVARICDLEPNKGRIGAEKAVVGYSYIDVGYELIQRWNFPPEICLAVQQHADPLHGETFSLDAALIHLAIELALQGDEPLTEQPDFWPATVADKTGLSWQICQDVLAEVREHGHGYDALIAA